MSQLSMIEKSTDHVQLLRSAAALNHRCSVVLTSVVQKSGRTGESADRAEFTPWSLLRRPSQGRLGHPTWATQEMNSHPG